MAPCYIYRQPLPEPDSGYSRRRSRRSTSQCILPLALTHAARCTLTSLCTLASIPDGYSLWCARGHTCLVWYSIRSLGAHNLLSILPSTTYQDSRSLPRRQMRTPSALPILLLFFPPPIDVSFIYQGAIYACSVAHLSCTSPLLCGVARDSTNPRYQDLAIV